MTPPPDRPAAPPPQPAGGPAPARRPAPALVPGGWAALALLAVVVLVILQFPATHPINYSPDFERVVDAGQLKRLTLIGKDRAAGEVRDPDHEAVKPLKLSAGQFTVLHPFSDRADLVKVVKDKEGAVREQLKKDKKDAPDPVVIVQEDEPLLLLAPLLTMALPAALVVAFFVFYFLPKMRDPAGGGFLNNYIRSPARRYEKGRGRTTFEDVAGMEGAKRELSEIVEFLRTPDKFARLGAQVPKGVLLVGPPGTGKTLLAKAVAGEANVPFYSINGSEFIQMFVGVGASRVRDLFKTAKENAPCVIFIDEIDAVGRTRGAGVGGGSDEREQTLNQILSEMDGFQPTETVIVLAATNRPDVLDTALLRPGRFDRHVTVDRPTWQGRLAILKVHTKTKPLADGVDLERVARAMIGMSGAELRNLCNEAALIATRGGKSGIEQKDFDAAGDRVRLGLTREEPFGAEEKRRTAYHEAGHALCGLLQPNADPIDRVSIIPRGRAGGVTLYAPDEDRVDHSASELSARLVAALGGRAADTLVFGEPLSGAAMDIKQATRLARLMVTQFGMSERLGPVHYRQGEEHPFLGREMHEGRDYSEATARIIDEEVQRLVSDALAKAEALLRQHRADLDKLVAALLVHEELDRDDVKRLLAGVPVDQLRPAPVPPAAPEPVAAAPAAAGEPAGEPPAGLAFGGA